MQQNVDNLVTTLHDVYHTARPISVVRRIDFEKIRRIEEKKQADFESQLKRKRKLVNESIPNLILTQQTNYPSSRTPRAGMTSQPKSLSKRERTISKIKEKGMILIILDSVYLSKNGLFAKSLHGFMRVKIAKYNALSRGKLNSKIKNW